MAMPASGCIAIINAPQTCGSICASVGQPTGSLLALGATACKPLCICMRNFYGYVGPATYHSVGFCLISQTGTNGVSKLVTNLTCVCSNVPMIPNQCYNITLYHYLNAGNCNNAYALVALICNSNSLYYCCIPNGQSAQSFSRTFNIKGDDTICIVSSAEHGQTGTDGTCSCVRSCITSVSNTTPPYGLFCKGLTSCTDCTIWACL